MSAVDGRAPGGQHWLRAGLADRAARYSLANTARAVTCGPLTAYLIATRFSGEIQGYHYTFASLLGLQVFAELGLGAVITQFASHEWAHLALHEGRIEGVARHRSRLAGLLRFALRWYAGASLAVLLPLGVVGFVFLNATKAPGVIWQAPWLALCAVTALRLVLTPALAILDGCGQVTETNGFRLADGLVVVAASWIAILAGFNLWTASFVALSSLAAATVFLGVRHRKFFGSLWREEIQERIHWREEVLPMQWRIALSWASGYFIFQLFTPVLFHYRGPREAGQFGLTWNMVASINAIGAAFLQTRAVSFGALVAAQNFAELGRRARHALGLAALGVGAGALALLAVLAALPALAPNLAARCLGLGPTAVLLAATVLMQISYAQSSYLRAFKREPYLGLSLAFATAVGGLTWWLGGAHGAAGVAWGYLAAVVFLVLPLGTWIFIRRRSEWQAPTVMGPG
jgi:hypothetical protein